MNSAMVNRTCAGERWYAALSRVASSSPCPCSSPPTMSRLDRTYRSNVAVVAGLISIASPSHACTGAPDWLVPRRSSPAGVWRGEGRGRVRVEAGRRRVLPPAANARMPPISASRSLVGSMAIRITGLAPSPRRSL